MPRGNKPGSKRGPYRPRGSAKPPKAYKGFNYKRIYLIQSPSGGISESSNLKVYCTTRDLCPDKVQSDTGDKGHRVVASFEAQDIIDAVRDLMDRHSLSMLDATTAVTTQRGLDADVVAKLLPQSMKAQMYQEARQLHLLAKDAPATLE